MSVKKWANRYLLSSSKRLSRSGLYEFLQQEFTSIEPHAKVLTVGGDGIVTELLQNQARLRRFEVVTLDIDESRNPDMVADYCGPLPFERGTFDCIVLSEVLEHFHTPEAGVRNTFELLRGGGKVVITTPFLFPLHERPYDYYRYTKYGLAHLLRDFGEVKISERNSWAEAVLVLTSRLYREPARAARVLGVALVVAGRILQPFARATARLVTSDFITTGYVATAYKSGTAPQAGPSEFRH